MRFCKFLVLWPVSFLSSERVQFQQVNNSYVLRGLDSRFKEI